VCLDGLAARVQRPRGRANQKVLYDAKRHTHTAQGLTLSTIHGALLWMDGGGPAVPSSGGLPRRRRAHLPRPLAARVPT
jgi:hypothetical protein